MRGHHDVHHERLNVIVNSMAMVSIDSRIARVAAVLRDRYRLKMPDAVHLAAAIHSGADRFVTGNRRDFASRITEIDIVHPPDVIRL